MVRRSELEMLRIEYTGLQKFLTGFPFWVLLVLRLQLTISVLSALAEVSNHARLVHGTTNQLERRYSRSLAYYYLPWRRFSGLRRIAPFMISKNHKKH